MRRRPCHWLCWLWLAMMPTIAAASVDHPLPADADEQRAQFLFAQLRCTVCEGQSLAASGATLAIEMRNLIREQVTQGRSDNDILSYFAERYGEEILMHPPVAERTVLLWLAPALFLLLGAGAAFYALRRQKQTGQT